MEKERRAYSRDAYGDFVFANCHTIQENGKTLQEKTLPFSCGASLLYVQRFSAGLQFC